VLIRLGGRALRALGEVSGQSFVGRICEDPLLAEDARATEILLGDGADRPAGFRAYLLREEMAGAHRRDTYALGKEFAYLRHGDIVRIDPRRDGIQALYRRSSPSNSFLVTERCDNWCVMCSQPPKEKDDSWIVDELEQVIPLISQDTRELGITGGEPSLLGSRLISLVEQMRTWLPRTAVHILSNGRNFSRPELARALGEVRHPDLMLGIPLYSDLPEVHDFVVQSRGAFDETIRGILNLKEQGVPVEVRFVVHRETFQGLPAFARFVARNLLFVDHVALMGLELMGFARANIDAVWIDPLDYQRELSEATEVLDRAGLAVSIYNHQLCVLDRGLHRFARASISDWKNLYLDDCDRCSLRNSCGGFFASSHLRRSRGISPVG
jgi:His-Xaa-Ser system radical SAM maturase HxsC